MNEGKQRMRADPRPTEASATARGPDRSSLEDAEAAVRQRHPHYTLLREGYESKSLPATWRCTLHDAEFQYAASALARPGNLGCPACKEARELAKRRARYADPDLERHLELIEERLDAAYATTWRLRAEGLKLKEIGEALGTSREVISQKIARIKRIFRF